MARRTTKTNRKDQEDAPRARARCLKIAEAGIKDDRHLSRFFSESIGDLIAGRLTHQTANSAYRGAHGLLRTAELRYRYGLDPKLQNDRIILVP